MPVEVTRAQVDETTRPLPNGGHDAVPMLPFLAQSEEDEEHGRFQREESLNLYIVV